MGSLSDEPGTLIGGRYELLGPAGQGAVAVVWRARCLPPSTRVVAVKRLLPEAENSSQERRRFVEEGRLGGQLADHPSIVRVLDFGLDDGGSYFLVMEWIEGVDLRRILTHRRRIGQPLPWPVVAHLGSSLVAALTLAHDRKDTGGRPSPIFHRDVSPQNVLVGADGQVKLGDFGLARAADRRAFTAPRQLLGKTAYMAPEQFQGDPGSVATDLFALGVLLWEALAGRPLFPGMELDRILAEGRTLVPPLEAERPDAPRRLTDAVHRALSHDPAGRFGSARDLGGILDSVLGAAAGRTQTEACARLVQEASGAAPGWTGLSPLDWPDDLSGSATHLVAAIDPASSELTVPGLQGVRRMSDSQRMRALQDFTEAEHTETRSGDVTITEALAVPAPPPKRKR